MYKLEFENEEIKKMITKEIIENVIECYYDDVEDANISDIVEIFIADVNDEVRYFFWDYNGDMVYENWDKKSDLN